MTTRSKFSANISDADRPVGSSDDRFCGSANEQSSRRQRLNWRLNAMLAQPANQILKPWQGVLTLFKGVPECPV